MKGFWSEYVYGANYRKTPLHPPVYSENQWGGQVLGTMLVDG